MYTCDESDVDRLIGTQGIVAVRGIKMALG